MRSTPQLTSLLDADDEDVLCALAQDLPQLGRSCRGYTIVHVVGHNADAGVREVFRYNSPDRPYGRPLLSSGKEPLPDEVGLVESGLEGVGELIVLVFLRIICHLVIQGLLRVCF